MRSDEYAPGTSFKKLVSLLGVSLSCEGEALIEDMNARGLVWCEQHHKEILTDFAKAEDRGMLFATIAKFFLCAALRNARYETKSKGKK